MLERIWPWSRIRDLEESLAFLEEEIDILKGMNLKLAAASMNSSRESFSQAARTMPSAYLDSLVSVAFKKTASDLNNLLRKSIVESLAVADLPPLYADANGKTPWGSVSVAFDKNSYAHAVEIHIPAFTTRVQVHSSEIE